MQTVAAQGYHADGGGLYLQVRRGRDQASPSKSWLFRYSRAGKERWMGLGSASAVGLAQARQQAAELRRLLAMDQDPLKEKRVKRAAAATAQQARQSFDECSQAYVAAHRDGWRNAKHAAQWENTLRQYASPVIGKLPVDQVALQHILRVLEPIWRLRTETASRLRGRIESVLDWATVRGYRVGDNPARWRGHLDQLLPAPGKLSKVEHHGAVPISQMPAFMQRLRQVDGIGARALEFAILTAARSGEVRGAVRSEIDADARIWTVPGTRMKSGREHRVPLSDAAWALLPKPLPGAPEALLFASPRGGALSDMTLTAVMRRMGVEAVPHGFRSTFRDWCAECTDYPREVAEMSLAHVIADKVEAAYRRGDLFAKRKGLLAMWALHCGAQ